MEKTLVTDLLHREDMGVIETEVEDRHIEVSHNT